MQLQDCTGSVTHALQLASVTHAVDRNLNIYSRHLNDVAIIWNKQKRMHWVDQYQIASASSDTQHPSNLHIFFLQL